MFLRNGTGSGCNSSRFDLETEMRAKHVVRSIRFFIIRGVTVQEKCTVHTVFIVCHAVHSTSFARPKFCALCDFGPTLRACALHIPPSCCCEGVLFGPCHTQPNIRWDEIQQPEGSTRTQKAGHKTNTCCVWRMFALVFFLAQHFGGALGLRAPNITALEAHKHFKSRLSLV